MDCLSILRSVMADPCASHFLQANAVTNEDVALALRQTCDLTSLFDALERGDIDQPATLLHDVEKMVHACKMSIDDKRSPIYRDSLALGSLFAERMKGVISQYERIWKSLIDPAGRSLRRRIRRERTQSKYNTRRYLCSFTSFKLFERLVIPLLAVSKRGVRFDNWTSREIGAKHRRHTLALE
ncbi:unnamed protein product [Strongylus vulgaris]|uniref:Bromo domain-containing protein n=1 Tax=Strongylus vulgaris TaxID=40348 RepID=A0A3P7KWC1_STRVU|nr:unnamed protein product [Strongylus vulgaris]